MLLPGPGVPSPGAAVAGKTVDSITPTIFLRCVLSLSALCPGSPGTPHLVGAAGEWAAVRCGVRTDSRTDGRGHRPPEGGRVGKKATSARARRPFVWFWFAPEKMQKQAASQREKLVFLHCALQPPERFFARGKSHCDCPTYRSRCAWNGSLGAVQVILLGGEQAASYTLQRRV
jgi:hypothetical protein